MQYKTVTVEHPQRQKNDAAEAIGTEYEQIINQHAAEDWKFLGIHPIQIRRRIGCMQWMLCGFIWGSHNFFQADVLVFFKDDGTDEYTGPIYSDEPQKSGDGLKKAGAAVAGATRNAVNFIRSEETANKLGALKNKAKSMIPNQTDSGDSADE